MNKLPFQMSRIDTSLDPFLELFAPDGSLVDTDDDSGGIFNARIDATLPATGTYTIIARDLSNDSTGSYTLDLDRIFGGSCPPEGSFTLTVTKAGTGSGTVTSSPAGISCGSDCTESFSSGTVVTLTATADSGSTFAGWSGDSDCTDGQVTMTANKTCTAIFNTELIANISQKCAKINKKRLK